MRPLNVKVQSGVAEIYAVPLGSDYVRVASVGASVNVKIEVEDTNESYILAVGDDVNLSPFSRLKISHDSIAEQAINLYIGSGTRAGSSKIGGAVSVAVASGITSTSDIAIVANAVAVSIAAANTARKSALITNLSSSVGTLRVGDAAIGAARGVPVEPGATATIETTAAIFAFSAAACTVSVLELV